MKWFWICQQRKHSLKTQKYLIDNSLTNKENDNWLHKSSWLQKAEIEDIIFFRKLCLWPLRFVEDERNSELAVSFGLRFISDLLPDLGTRIFPPKSLNQPRLYSLKNFFYNRFQNCKVDTESL